MKTIRPERDEFGYPILSPAVLEFGKFLINYPRSCPTCSTKYSIYTMESAKGEERKTMKEIMYKLGTNLFLVAICKKCKTYKVDF